MDKYLFIAEKPSVAKEFAKVLGVTGNQGNGYLESDKYSLNCSVLCNILGLCLLLF